jgi:hypothetical protein
LGNNVPRRAILKDEYQASSGIAVEGAKGYGFVTGHGFSHAAKTFPFPGAASALAKLCVAESKDSRG